MKWYEEAIIALLAISTNTMVTITSKWETQVLVIITEIACRTVWTVMVFLLFKWIYKNIKSITIR